MKLDYQKKFLALESQGPFSSLHDEDKTFIKEKAFEFYLSFQELMMLATWAQDLRLWQEGNLQGLWPKEKLLKKDLFIFLKKSYDEIKNQKKDYATFLPQKKNFREIKIAQTPFEDKILGLCPVASEKTRCCNLQTLDAARNCGFDCSYCSIQSFYHDDTVLIDKNLKEKLQNLLLDPEKIYHIGTGQSSDSLMWGDKEGILTALVEFAKKNPNVILELKTKSANVAELLALRPPRNVIVTWTLNTETIIKNEEFLTASLKERLNAARLVSDAGQLVGFHFHPMVYYKDFEKDYADVAKKVLTLFKPEEVALLSLGTLTYTKSVMNKIRKRGMQSKILQMPFDEIAGKFSYPREIKVLLFKNLFEALSFWKDKVYFYMCMEDPSLWKEVFGFEYQNNDEFEFKMKKAYLEKINEFPIKSKI